MPPTRCHFSAIFENVLKLFWQLLPAFVLPILTSGRLTSQPWIFLAVIPACFLLALVIQYFIWLKTWLSTDADNLLIVSGLIWKKHQAIPFEKINTVDLSRNLFQRALGTCRIKIDTGAVTSGSKTGSEVNLVFTLAQAEAIRSLVLTLAAGVASLHDDYAYGPASAEDNRLPAADGGFYVRAESPASGQAAPFTSSVSSASSAASAAVVRARPVDFFLYGLTQNKLLGGIVVFFSCFTFMGEIFGEQFNKWFESYFAPAWQQISQLYLVTVILAALASLVLFYVLASLVSILYAIVRFYNFRASREGDNIHIEYGLLTAKSYTIPLKNIHAVIISQNLLRQWLKQCSVEIVSIGYGDEKNEIALLFPLIRIEQLETLLGRILPEYQEQLELTPAPAAALRRYILLPALTLILICGAIAFAWLPVLYALIPLLPGLILNRWLNYRNAGISYSPERIEVRTGGFNRRRYRIRTAAVQSVGCFSTPLTERVDLRTYKIDYHAPSMKAVITLRFMQASHLEDLRHLLDEN